eukprot:TRINITY_DN19032_c0_g1_i3.p2 TRINITY_DN19032_c0_g1~~TRINITY_DN19032_c0_g1_i3.p2  ORF type:complete len:130 (-),score=23.75 TRINITY_DN19032_c0_g1_i3:493-882(-)
MELDPIPDDDTCIQTMAGQADRAVARWLADSREGLAEDSEYDESSRKGSLLSNSTESSMNASTSTESQLSSMESEGPQIRSHSVPNLGKQAELPSEPRRNSCPEKAWRGPRRVRGHRRDEMVYSANLSS